MKNDLELAYIGIGSRDRAAMDRYLSNAIGLIPACRAPADASAWRMDERVHRVLVHDNSADDAMYLGFEFRDRVGLEATMQRLRAMGYTVEAGSAGELAERQVQMLAWVSFQRMSKVSPARMQE